METFAHDYNLWITVAAVAFALLTMFASLRLNAGRRSAVARWRKRAADLDQRNAKMESVFGAYPGLVLVWEETAPAPNSDWGAPRTFGSAAALASLVRFAAPGKSKDMAKRILSGLADHDTINDGANGPTLRQLVENLRRKGESFSVTITLPGGKMIEADGNVAGAQVVLWIEDASIRGQDEAGALARLETEKLAALSDPVAFVEIMGRAPFPIWRLSGAGQLEWANDHYIQAVSAKSLDELIARQTLLDEACAEQAQRVLAENQLIKDARPLVLYGKRKTTLISMFPISGGVAGMAVDASEAEQLRLALKLQIKHHDETLNNLGEAVVVFGADQKMSFHNHAFAKMFGLDTQWFKTKPSHGEWLDHMRDNRRLPEQPDFRRWRQQELSFYINWPDEMAQEVWSLPDSRELRLVRMRHAQGGMSILFDDITDQMDMQSRYNSLINVQRATLDKLSDGVSVFGTDGRLKLHNSAFETLWDLQTKQLQNQPLFRDLIPRMLPHYHDREFWAEMVARTTDISPQSRRLVASEIQRSDDSILAFFSQPLPDGATLIAWNDITKAHRTETALRERAEAVEAADRLKSEFVSHVSYQLRTPLTTIAGYAELLQSGSAGELNDKQSEYVFAIQSASEELTKTFDDILDIAAIEADAIDLELGDVDVFPLLENALDYVATKADDTRITMQLDCREDIGIIRADEQRIKQILFNLLSNALRFTKPGGHILLGADHDGISGPDGGIRIWVRDNGVGIPSERQPQVFESFKSTRGGAGLGLALVERFVDCHGGWVELESEPEKGTTVTCHLPRMAMIEAAHPELNLQHSG